MFGEIARRACGSTRGVPHLGGVMPHCSTIRSVLRGLTLLSLLALAQCGGKGGKGGKGGSE